MTSVDAKMLIDGQNDRIVENFRHANEAGVSKGHGHVGLLVHESENWFKMLSQIEPDNKRLSAYQRR